LTFSVIIATKGRESLIDTIASVVSQTVPGDEVLIDVNRLPWGNRAKQRQMEKAKGDWLLFIDDDDAYVPGAFEVVRSKLTTLDTVHVFRMRYVDTGMVLWRRPVLEHGNVGCPMVITPNIPEKLGEWTDRYTADWHFVQETARRIGNVQFHEEVICDVGMAQDVRRPLPGEPGH